VISTATETQHEARRGSSFGGGSASGGGQRAGEHRVRLPTGLRASAVRSGAEMIPQDLFLAVARRLTSKTLPDVPR
jgi:hypothetical protein